MTIVRTIDQICEWLNANVCEKVLLKKPPRDKEKTNEKYAYELIHPYAFPLYLPVKDMLPPDATAPVPSICVQMEYGSDDYNNRELNIALGFGSWNAGAHPKDWLIPEGTDTEYKDKLSHMTEGWRDLWNFVDVAVTAIESSMYMGPDVEIVKNEPLEFGPYKEQDSIPILYPYWFAYCRFKVRSMILRNNQDLAEFL
ncbi:MAG: hypothetical protein IJT16_11505 [Lachnospiraceae bacterium]|nr:hypothetical protein [Lachnospiraceae bacterium]